MTANTPKTTHSLCASCGDYAYEAPLIPTDYTNQRWYLGGGKPRTVYNSIEETEVNVHRRGDITHARISISCPHGSLTADLDLASLTALRNALHDAIVDIRHVQADTASNLHAVIAAAHPGVLA